MRWVEFEQNGSYQAEVVSIWLIFHVDEKNFFLFYFLHRSTSYSK